MDLIDKPIKIKNPCENCENASFDFYKDNKGDLLYRFNCRFGCKGFNDDDCHYDYTEYANITNHD